VIRWGTGVRSHPAVAELRAHRIALARLLVALRIPDDDDHCPANRSATCGVYKISAS
jgi:hypothetical protein